MCQHASGHVGRRDSNRLRATPAGRGRPVWRDVAGNLPARNRGHPSRVAAPSRERGWGGVRGAGQTQRGESGDTTPWSFERELEDVTALAAAAAPDGPVTLVGSSFGGLLAMGAADRVEVDRLVLYEPPMPAATVEASAGDCSGARLSTVALVNRWGVPTVIHYSQPKNTLASQAGSVGIHGFNFRRWQTQFGRTSHRVVLTTPETMRSV